MRFNDRPALKLVDHRFTSVQFRRVILGIQCSSCSFWIHSTAAGECHLSGVWEISNYFHSAIYMAWYYAVTNFGNPAALAAAVWPYPFTAIGNSFAALTTHIYLAIRIWRLTSNKFLYGVAILLAILSFILGMITGIKGWIMKFASKLPRTRRDVHLQRVAEHREHDVVARYRLRQGCVVRVDFFLALGFRNGLCHHRRS
ncbi:hypothetical protein OG21DRAFT_322120 [Imleria badia]|nr:hypothetical protein OG21DRAFT_322120 [Imleria badia]